MSKPDLQHLAHWLDATLVALLEERRHQNKEWRRRRKLRTLETFWLMLAVSLDTQRSSRYEILRLATGQLAIGWSISVAAFCKARAHFSPRRPDLVAWCAGFEAPDSLQSRSHWMQVSITVQPSSGYWPAKRTSSFQQKQPCVPRSSSVLVQATISAASSTPVMEKLSMSGGSSFIATAFAVAAW